MSAITPNQSREARRELGISQADVAGAISVNRVYVSDFESGNLIRLTNAQLRKLRAFYESKIEEARANGDDIAVVFGEESDGSKALISDIPRAPQLSKRSIEQNVLEIDPAIPDDVAASAKKLLGECAFEIMPMLNQQAEAGFLSEFDGKTAETLQAVFGQLSLAGFLAIQMTCPGVFRAKAMTDDPKTVYDVVYETFKDRLIEAGLIVEGQTADASTANEKEVVQ